VAKVLTLEEMRKRREDRNKWLADGLKLGEYRFDDDQNPLRSLPGGRVVRKDLKEVARTLDPTVK